MAKNPKRTFIRIDDHIWTHDEVRALSDSSALAFIYMIAWSNANKLDGIVTHLGANFTDAGPEEIQELLTAGFIEPHERGWQIVKFAEWQMTNNEWSAVSAVAASNGSKGGIAKQVNQERAAGAAMEAIPGDPREGWMMDALGAWPPPGSGFKVEAPKFVRPAFMASVTSEEDWEGFQAALNARIARYEADPAPRHSKRKFLGSFRGFCEKWRDEPIPKPRAPQPPKKKLEDDGVEV